MGKSFKQFINPLHHVYIHKSYFPDSTYKTGQEDFEQWNVPASSRTEAANLVWKENGERLLKLMKPKQTKLPRKISLYVSSPKAGVGGKAGRLTPILVYTGD